MGKFEMGYEFRKLSERLELLEKKTYRKKDKKPLLIDKNDLLIKNPPVEFVANTDDDKASILAVDVTPPFTDRFRSWDSGSEGNLFVSGSTNSNENTGELTVRASHEDYSVGNSDRGSRSLEARYAFRYRNPYKEGRLRIRAEYYIDKGDIRDEVHDEFGRSAVDTGVYQSFRIKIWKNVNDEWKEMKKSMLSYHEHETTYGYGEGGGGHSYWVDKGNSSYIHNVTTELILEKNQSALVYAGIWSGLSFWTDDFSVNHHTTFKVRLDKIIFEVV